MGAVTLLTRPAVGHLLPQDAGDRVVVLNQYETSAAELLPAHLPANLQPALGTRDQLEPEVQFGQRLVLRPSSKDSFSKPLPLSLPVGSQGAIGQGDASIAPIGTAAFAPQPATQPPKGRLEPLVFLAQERDQDDTSPESDPELGIIRVRNQPADPELGILRIREQPVVPETAPQEAPKVAFLNARLSVASSDNILLAVNDVGGLTGDEFLRPGISVAFYPPLGPQTFLISSADFGLQRYTTQSEFNYDDLRFQLGVRQGLFPRTYGQLLFTYQQLFRPGSPRFRFFENKALSFTLGRRDPLTDQLTLNSYYQVQWNDAASKSSPNSSTNYGDFDRITQFLGTSLNYTISPQWQTGVSYQITLADYTRQERYDTFHQLIGQLTYRLTPEVRMSLYGGWSFGRSSEPRIRFDDTLFGFTIDATVPLF